MIVWLIQKSIEHRVMVALMAVMLGGLGIWSLSETPVDAIPDLSDVQVIVHTPFQGQAPQVVEEQVTYPLTTALMSVPGAKTVRGYSFFGFSLAYVIFEDGTDLYWARSRVLEYLNFAKSRLPPNVTPTLGPDATGVGWVYMYTLVADETANLDLSQLRSIQDWYLRYALMSVPGVAEVASVGGFVRQYQVVVDPEKLRAFGVTLSQVKSAIVSSNQDVGGRVLEMGETEYMIRGRGTLRGIEDLESIPLAVEESSHTPILLKQVAHVQIGPEIRRGLAELNGEGEVVAGIIVMRSGENALKVIKGVKEKLRSLEAGLPEGVSIETAYDRSSLIERAIATLKEKIVEELLLVALICFLFLLHLRSALVVMVSLPLAILIAFIMMRAMGINANIMSLGGIALAIGVMVDAAIVMVENLHKHKEQDPDTPHLELVMRSSKEVGPALFFSLLIVTVSFFPVFMLEQQEGRLFKPLAYTKTFSMLAASFLAITLIPALMAWFVKGKPVDESRNYLSRFLKWCYRPIIGLVLRFPKGTLVAALALLLVTILPLSRLGSEFMPPLNEGDLLYMPTTPPGISITKAKELLQQTDRLIKSHPQVQRVLGKVGRADTATDPAPLSMIETIITLAPKSEWPSGQTIEKIIEELDALVQFPGLTNAWTMPIKTRIDMLATGIKTPVGIKLMGDDLVELSKLGVQIEGALRPLKGVASVYAERVVGGKYIDIDVNRTEAARFGLRTGDVQDVIQSAIGGMNVTYTVEGLARYPVNVRFPRDFRSSLDQLRRVSVPTPMGHTVPLGAIATVSLSEGPPVIKSENARQSAWIYVDLDVSDIGLFVQEAKAVIADKIELPRGVSLVWSGQYEYMERAKEKLKVAIPLTLMIILILLYMHFQQLGFALLVMGTLPFAAIGGVWLLYFSGYNLSVAVAVGFIALMGLAAETSVVMLVYLEQAFERFKKSKQELTQNALKKIVIYGSVERLRPKIMTVTTTIVGLLPIMFGSDTGTRVMKRIAAPMVGGLVSSAVLTLLVIPALYYLVKNPGSPREPETHE